MQVQGMRYRYSLELDAHSQERDTCIPKNAVLIPRNEVREYRYSQECDAHSQESDCRCLFEEWVRMTGRRVTRPWVVLTLRLHSLLSMLA